MCVEIDLRKPLLAKYKLKNKIFRIEYEGLHIICFSCGIYGHNKDSCPGGEPIDGREEGHEQIRDKRKDVNLEHRAEVLEEYGAWMMVHKNSRKKNSKIPARTQVNGNLPVDPRRKNTKTEGTMEPYAKPGQ